MPDHDATETDAHDVTQATGIPSDGGPSGTEDDSGDGTSAPAGDDAAPVKDDDAPAAEDATGSATEAAPAPDKDEEDAAGSEAGTDPAPSSDDDAAPTGADGELDMDAATARLEEVEDQIEKGRQALADVTQEVEPEPDGPPIAAGEGAANAPPG